MFFKKERNAVENWIKVYLNLSSLVGSVDKGQDGVALIETSEVGYWGFGEFLKLWHILIGILIRLQTWLSLSSHVNHCLINNQGKWLFPTALRIPIRIYNPDPIWVQDL